MTFYLAGWISESRLLLKRKLLINYIFHWIIRLYFFFVALIVLKVSLAPSALQQLLDYSIQRRAYLDIDEGVCSPIPICRNDNLQRIVHAPNGNQSPRQSASLSSFNEDIQNKVHRIFRNIHKPVLGRSRHIKNAFMIKTKDSGRLWDSRGAIEIHHIKSIKNRKYIVGYCSYFAFKFIPIHYHTEMPVIGHQFTSRRFGLAHKNVDVLS